MKLTTLPILPAGSPLNIFKSAQATPRVVLLALIFMVVNPCVGQLQRFVGKHYGDHESWEYFNTVHTSRSGDTIQYLEIRNNRNELLPAPPQHRHAIKMVLRGDAHRLLYDSIFYFGRLMLVVTRAGDSLVVNGNPFNGSEVQLYSSLEALQLKLKYRPLGRGYQKDVAFIDLPHARRFRVKWVGEAMLTPHGMKPIACAEVAVFSLDSLNVGDAKLFVSAKTHDVVLKEYVINERSSAGSGLKSMATEMQVRPDYEINLNEIVTPTASDYVEAAFAGVNRGVHYQHALDYLSKALELEVSGNALQGYLSILARFEPNTDPLTIIKRYWNSPNLGIMDIHRMAREYLAAGNIAVARALFEFNYNRAPQNYITLVGLARVHSEQGDFAKARTLLQDALSLDMDEAIKASIRPNLERVTAGEKMQ